MADMETLQWQDTVGKFQLGDIFMTRVYIADLRPDVRSAFRLLLMDLQMDVVGEASDWTTTLADAPVTRLDMLLVDWDLLPPTYPNTALRDLRKQCPSTMVIVLIIRLEARKQTALLSGADVFISKIESPDRVVERLRLIGATFSTNGSIDNL